MLAFALCQKKTCFVVLTNPQFYILFQSADPVVNPPRYLLKIKRLSKGELVMKTYPLNTTIIDMKFLDMRKHLLEIFFNISPATHESQQLIIRKQVQFRITLSDLNQGASYFPVELVQLLTDLSEICIHNNIFADEKDGIVNIVTFYKLPMQFQQIGK